MDPSVLLKSTWRAQWPDPVEDRKKLLTLRDLMDQRRIREQQYQMHQLAMQKSQQEMADAQQLRDALSGGIPVDANLSDMVKRFGPKGVDLYSALRQAQNAEATRKTAELTQQKTALDLQGERAKREANTYAAVTALPQDQQQDWWDTNVGGGLPVDRPPTAFEEQAKYAEAYGGKALQDRQLARDRDIRETEKYRLEVAKLLPEVTTAQNKAAGTEPITPYQREQLNALDTPGKVAAWMSDPRRTLEERSRGEFILSKIRQGKLYTPEEMEQQLKLRSVGKGGADTSGLVDAVIQNPALYDNLTPTAQTAIGPKLVERGFTGFGKPLSEGAITKLSESRSAIASLKDLREVVKANEQYIGPIAGFAALNPYHPARKAQADIDRVRQRVGKALEGGVLRKEDEEKYKKILATLQDDPKTAIYKIDRLGEDLARDIEIFSNEQKAAGRRVESSAQPAQSSSVPKVGESFNGKKVTKVTKVQ